MIFLSGYSKSDTAENMIIDGEVGFLQKPFRLHEASQIISKTLGNSVS
ncbi:MAG: hypothetical protein GY863_22990 [bacterium]|nr:hypothetical protein [bacterium]